MRVVGYWSGRAYYREAKLLVASLERVGIRDYWIKEYPPASDWDEGVALKAEFIAECFERFGGRFLYVDVDAVFHENPADYFDKLDCDFAAHWFQGPKYGYVRRNDNWFLSGTMWWGSTEKARELLAAWRRRNAEKRAVGITEGAGQANLAEVIPHVRGLNVVRLLGRYCYVWDKPWAYPPGEKPIIEHLVASRENRKRGCRRLHLGRRRRQAELWRLIEAAKVVNE